MSYLKTCVVRHKSPQLDTVLNLVKAWAEEVNTPFSLMLYMLFESAMNGDVDAVIEITSIDYLNRPSTESDSGKVKREYPLWYWCKTYPNYPGYGEEDRAKAAIEKWKTTEDRCRETNRRLAQAYRNNRGFQRLMAHVQKTVARTLGKFESSKITMRHGDGSVVGANGARVHPAVRFTSLVINPWFLSKFKDHADHSNRFQLENIKFGVSSVGHLVPKDAFEDRYIALEQIGDMQGQLGFGDYLMERLAKRCNIHIKDRTASKGLVLDQIAAKPVLAPEFNGIMAMLGSENGMYATIDASSSGDHWTMYFAWLAFRKADPAWWEWLKTCRSRFHTLPTGERVKLVKMATAGNGFLFPLQTLFYYAIVSYFVRKREWHNEFGDDVCVHTMYADIVMRALEFVGHKINAKKSFTRGLVRESCGYDWHNGVRLYKSKAKTHTGVHYDDWAKELHNSLFDIFSDNGSNPGFFHGRATLGVLRAVIRRHSATKWNYVPRCSSDGGLVSEIRPQYRYAKRKGDIDYYTVHRFKNMPQADNVEESDDEGVTEVKYRITRIDHRKKQKTHKVVCTLRGDALLQFALWRGMHPTYRHTSKRRVTCLIAFS